MLTGFGMNMASLRFAVTCLPLVLCVVVNGAIENPVVTTNLGKIRGTTLSIADHEKQAYAFFNVPFVAPPVGELRFQPPQPMEPWEGIRDATEPGASCPQVVGELAKMLDEEFGLKIEERTPSEDCLYLNVYTPSLSGKRPVMVFIHGGGLLGGSTQGYDMRVYAIREDIVGVTIQYRLGALGFLSTGDDVVKGNMGFKDQVAALRWVQANIHRFGGDPNQVTIFGESAGSWSVSMHLFSPMSNGLFHRGIMQSGSSQESTWFSPPIDVKAAADKLGTLLGCPTGDSKELVKCLRNQTPESLVSPEGASPEDAASLMWVPRVDKECFPKDPSTLLSDGEYNSDVEIIAGVDEVEGYLLSKFIAPVFLEPAFNSSQFRSFVTAMLGSMYPKSSDQWEAMTDAVMATYSDKKEGDSLRRAFVEFMGDFMITRSTYQTARDLTKNSQKDVYFYEFKHRSQLSRAPHYIIADHGHDLSFTFGTSYTLKDFDADIPKFGDDDKIVEGLLMKYWANFARTGNPNGEGLPKWPQFKEDGSYLVITTNPTIEQNYQHERMDLWLNTLPAIAEKSNKKEEL